MVRENPVYLFIGQDNFSKDIELKRTKERFIPQAVQDFNVDRLYAKGLNLLGLQEKLACLPIKSKKRLIVIKQAEDLREEIQEFILQYVKKPLAHIVLVLDLVRQESRENDEFINRLSRYAKVLRFKEAAHLDTFTLSRQVRLKRLDYALRILHQLLRRGERPERILGGLRYSLEQDAAGILEKRKIIKLLLNCDLEMKTGRVRPETFALERLVVSLCCLK